MRQRTMMCFLAIAVIIGFVCIFSSSTTSGSIGTAPVSSSSSDASSSADNEGISLLGGRFETTTNVNSYLNLALDVAQMKKSNDPAIKRDIYARGTNRGSSDVTLQRLSLEAKTTMKNSPIYNIFRHAFLALGNAEEGETEGLFDESPVSEFADTLVDDLFALRLDEAATDATVVLNVWQSIVFEIFESLNECSKQNYPRGLAALDRAAAMWIGHDQQVGTVTMWIGHDQQVGIVNSGHLMYSLTEAVGHAFVQDRNGDKNAYTKETKVNKEVLDMFSTIQTILQEKKCDNAGGYVEMRRRVKKMVSLMTIPLLQTLIYEIMTLDESSPYGSSYVELYALATIPRVSACDPIAYDKLVNLLVLQEFGADSRQEAIDLIQSVYRCFDVTCADIGDYHNDVHASDVSFAPCNENHDVHTDTDGTGTGTAAVNAKEASYMDRDLFQMDIFMKFHSFDVARDWYVYGWNSNSYSFQQLAKNELFSETTTSESLHTYYEYWNGEEDFAHTYISNIMERIPPYDIASESQLRNLIIGTLRHTTTFLSSASALEAALTECRRNDVDAALKLWDMGARFYTGSMKDAALHGNNSDDYKGEFWFATSKKLCSEFDACSAYEFIIDGLKKGIDYLNDESCNDVETVLYDQILFRMIIPFFQGTIKYAALNEVLDEGSGDANLAIGATFARALLPIINDVSPESATTLRSEMDFQLSSKPVKDGYVSVVNAFRVALELMEAPTCDDIGIYKHSPGDEAKSDLCHHHHHQSDENGKETNTGTNAGDSTVVTSLREEKQGPKVTAARSADIAFEEYAETSLMGKEQGDAGPSHKEDPDGNET